MRNEGPRPFGREGGRRQTADGRPGGGGSPTWGDSFHSPLSTRWPPVPALHTQNTGGCKYSVHAQQAGEVGAGFGCELRGRHRQQLAQAGAGPRLRLAKAGARVTEPKAQLARPAEVPNRATVITLSGVSGDALGGRQLMTDRVLLRIGLFDADMAPTPLQTPPTNHNCPFRRFVRLPPGDSTHSTYLGTVCRVQAALESLLSADLDPHRLQTGCPVSTSLATIGISSNCPFVSYMPMHITASHFAEPRQHRRSSRTLAASVLPRPETKMAVGPSSPHSVSCNRDISRPSPLRRRHTSVPKRWLWPTHAPSPNTLITTSPNKWQLPPW